MDRQMLVRQARAKQRRQERDDAAAFVVRLQAVESAGRHGFRQIKALVLGVLIGLMCVGAALAVDSRKRAASVEQMRADYERFMRDTKLRQDIQRKKTDRLERTLNLK